MHWVIRRFALYHHIQGDSTRTSWQDHCMSQLSSLCPPIYVRLIQNGWMEKWHTHSGTNLPPSQCLPLYPLTPSLGAVKLINASGVNVSTALWFPWSSSSVYKGCGPSVTDQPLGMSTDKIGNWDDLSKLRIVSNGLRTGGWKLKPIIRLARY